MRRIQGGRVGLWLGVSWWVGVAGCSGAGTDATQAGPRLQGVKVVVAAVGDPAVLATVSAQRGEWEASRGASCTVLDRPVEPSALGGAHVLVFRGDRLGDLVDAGALAVLPESAVQPPAEPAGKAAEEDRDADDDGPPPSADPDSSAADALQFTDVIPAFREQVSKYGRDRVALPYGGSALVLVYNRAAFRHEANRDAARGAGVSLEPPKTWEDLDALARFFHGRDWDGGGEKRSGIALAFGADPEGVGDTAFLARAAALGQHRDHYSLLFDSETMEPRVTSPPFVEALEKTVALKSYAPPGAEGWDAEAARSAFREGRAALLIDRAERFGRWGGPKVKSVGVAPLPGSPRVFEPALKKWDNARPANRPAYLPFGGGWLVAVAASARGAQREAALDFAKYLINPDTSNRVRSDRDFPMLPVRASQVGQGLLDPRSAPGVESRDWSEAVGATLNALRVVPGLRIPQAEGYLADLARGRIAAVQGQPAAEALKQVADAWDARTKALGPNRQLWHYRRSLNSLVTTPRPPDR